MDKKITKIITYCYIPFSPLSVSMPLLLFHSVLSLLFHQVLYFPFPFTLLPAPILFLPLYYFLCPCSYYFPFPLYFHSPFLSLVAWYWYHKHCLSSITLDHVLLTLLENPYPYLLPIPCIIFIPLIHLSVSFSI